MRVALAKYPENFPTKSRRASRLLKKIINTRTKRCCARRDPSAFHSAQNFPYQHTQEPVSCIHYCGRPKVCIRNRLPQRMTNAYHRRPNSKWTFGSFKKFKEKTTMSAFLLTVSPTTSSRVFAALTCNIEKKIGLIGAKSNNII